MRWLQPFGGDIVLGFHQGHGLGAELKTAYTSFHEVHRKFNLAGAFGNCVVDVLLARYQAECKRVMSGEIKVETAVPNNQIIQVVFSFWDARFYQPSAILRRQAYSNQDDGGQRVMKKCQRRIEELTKSTITLCSLIAREVPRFEKDFFNYQARVSEYISLAAVSFGFVSLARAPTASGKGEGVAVLSPAGYADPSSIEYRKLVDLEPESARANFDMATCSPSLSLERFLYLSRSLHLEREATKMTEKFARAPLASHSGAVEKNAESEAWGTLSLQTYGALVGRPAEDQYEKASLCCHPALLGPAGLHRRPRPRHRRSREPEPPAVLYKDLKLKTGVRRLAVWTFGSVLTQKFNPARRSLLHVVMVFLYSAKAGVEEVIAMETICSILNKIANTSGVSQAIQLELEAPLPQFPQDANARRT
ncbi:hypothetical protein AYO20_08406 [Fonsecaea nubica]|uniref:Uncharacterized protein n=1 Tax=Fonsecaea nubica TaxID=856822 RepID=A0A178CQ78_9EURO|nr:hypothetical protein AYO20_08406 [Fonsecaea nubica]OAL31075.1 hypothetical protein AYO20_08406 [Fonsecaea nubica]